MPDAVSVDAYLPDGRVIELVRTGDVWGGNFEIPANAPEGQYDVKVVAKKADGSRIEKSWSYTVDRTAPTGKAEFLVEAGKRILVVTAKLGLAEVAAYSQTGEKWVLKEEAPGVYRLEIAYAGKLTIVLKDRAGNKGELRIEGEPNSKEEIANVQRSLLGWTL